MDVSSFISALAGTSSGGGHLQSESSLVYTLDAKQKALSFNEFILIIKSLHGFRLVDLQPNPENQSVVVKLGYNCSMKNVRARLGSVPATVFKVNPNIAIDQLSALESLRNKFGFGGEITQEENQLPEPSKKRKH